MNAGSEREVSAAAQHGCTLLFYNGHTEEVFELGSATHFREIETDVARSAIVTGLWAFSRQIFSKTKRSRKNLRQVVTTKRAAMRINGLRDS